MQYKLYADNFRKRRLECLLKAKETCLRCGRRNRSFAFNAEDEVYIVYNHAAHVFANEKKNPNAPLICLCPTCHYYYDHPRGDTPEGIADWEFIGLVAKRCIEEDARRHTDSQTR